MSAEEEGWKKQFSDENEGEKDREGSNPQAEGAAAPRKRPRIQRSTFESVASRGYQPREGNGYQPRGNYQQREGGYQPREGGYQPRQGGYQP
ncbi:MAG: pseudouridine synthase, partial [Prevotellaceae bacterium]|nr:pseudouridine synthase [Prevotellaceae bacterium]